MNLFFKSYRINLIFFLVIACVSCISPGFGQDVKLRMTPWIQEIDLPSQYSEIPNETFFRDRQGVLYIGKRNGLSIVEGTRVSHVPLNGPVYVAEDGTDTLYYAAENDLGFLIKGTDHGFRAVSRKHLLPVSRRTFVPSGIYHSSGVNFISTDQGIYRLSRTETKFLDRQDGPADQPYADSARNGEIIEQIANKIGIPASGIVQVFIRNNSEIWILGPHSLHQFIDPSPLYLLEPGLYSTGRILNSTLSDDGILLGTSSGIYLISRDEGNRNQWSLSELLPESSQSIHLFSSLDDQVIAAGSRGIYQIRDRHALLIDSGSFTGIEALKQGTFIASGKAGTIRYRQGNGGWVPTMLDPSLQSAHSFTTFDSRIFLLCNNGVYRSNGRGDKFSPVPFQSEDQLFRLLLLDEELLLLGSRQVYRYDGNEEIFQPLPFNHKSGLLSNSEMILPANGGGYWVLQNKNDVLSRVFFTRDLNDPDTAYHLFPVIQNLGEVIDLSYSDSVLFLTGKDKVSLFDLHHLEQVPDPVSVSQGEPEPLHGRGSFHFYGLELQHEPEPLFRYRVLPRTDAWSPWSTSRECTLSGLRRGSYSLEVQAMNLYGTVSESALLPFTVAPPFYAAWYAFAIYGILLLVGLFLFQKWRLLNYQRAESRISKRMELRIQNLAAEKEKTDKLMAEILTEKTANQIKSKGKAKWDKYDRATVLFSDIQGFTRIAEEMNPEKLIDELDQFFFHFDSVVEKYNIEKIKTIGDAYMAAGGIPHKNSTNPVEVVLAALEMQAYMQQLKSTRANIWDLRIGIHTGPVIAGVVGHKKISYDIWGDTVNTASRMESSGTPGKINISGITYGMVKDYFICEYRGKLPVKYKGNIDMYYVNGLRPELSVDLKAIPNKRFFIKLQILRLGDLEESVFEGILKSLPESMHFHRLEYARKVYNQTFLLCRAEEIEEEDRLLVRTAALMLYTGLTQSYHNFQNRSSVISREILSRFKYSERQIDQICNLILSTKEPFDPKNRLEKILIDAKMEYIGRSDYTEHIKQLFRELRENGSKINGQQFKKQQLELLYGFQFYTIAANRLREVSGEEQMANLEKERWI